MANKIVRKSHMWTKEDIKTVVSLWETTTKGDLANKLGINESQLNTMVMRMRKAGLKLPHKRKNGQAEAFLLATLKELKLIK